jgi:hypothetical protein
VELHLDLEEEVVEDIMVVEGLHPILELVAEEGHHSLVI